MGMFEFLVHNFVIDFFASYGWIGFISYIILVYGMLFWLGVKLKSRGFFEIEALRFIYFIAVLIALGIAGGSADGIAGGIVENIAVSKYNKALEYLKNNDVDNCLKYLNQSLYLLAS